MTIPNAVHLNLTPERIERYCEELARTVSKPERRVAALDAVKTFLAAMADAGEQADPAFVEVKAILARHFDSAREALQREQTVRLAEALRQQKLSSITAIYQSVSRDGFWQLLTGAEHGLETALSHQIGEWCREWLAQARERSEKASPYPDAIDFQAAGIDVGEYTAMTDLARFFAD